jgi:hypothetical protein
MSLFGKILALLNVIGAIGLFVLGVIDYGKRQGWAYSVLQCELTLRGLPLDDQERDDQGQPLVTRVSEKNLADLFAQAGQNPQPTQVAEVQRIQKLFEDRLDSLKAADGRPLVRQQMELLARVLLPLSSSYPEREELIAARYYFASDARVGEFQNRYRAGFADAMKRLTDDVKAGPSMTFEEAMYVAMRAQGGEPSDAFTATLIGQLPSDVRQLKTVNFDDAFVKAVHVQLEALRERLKAKFARALLGPDVKAAPAQGSETQKRVIARTLFSLCQPIAEEATDNDPKLKGMDRGSSKYAAALLDTDAYKTSLKRVYVVCGLRTTLAAIADEVAEVRRQADAAMLAQDQDLITFVGDHAALVEELRDRYELLKAQEERVKDNADKLTAQEALVKKRKGDVDSLTAELMDSQKETATAVAGLRDTSDKVLKLRLQVRDAIKQTEDAEKEIRRLEAVIIAREKATSKSKK